MRRSSKFFTGLECAFVPASSFVGQRGRQASPNFTERKQAKCLWPSWPSLVLSICVHIFCGGHASSLHRSVCFVFLCPTTKPDFCLTPPLAEFTQQNCLWGPTSAGSAMCRRKNLLGPIHVSGPTLTSSTTQKCQWALPTGLSQSKEEVGGGRPLKHSGIQASAFQWGYLPTP